MSELFTVTPFELPPMGENAYLLIDRATGISAVIDPGTADKKLMQACAQAKIQWILLTHGHADHIGAVAELRAKTGAKVIAHVWEKPLLASAAWNLTELFGFPCTVSVDQTVTEGDVLHLGETAVTVLHTPGHTGGSVCYRCGNVLFSGDTLFSGTMGRTDFPTGDPEAMRQSLQRLAKLEGTLRVLPGHGAETTVAQECRTNPYLQGMIEP